MDTFKIKKNDTRPYLAVTLQDSDGSALDLTSASVQFNLANSSYTNVYSTSADITNASSGEVEYRWDGTNDTNSTGTFWGEFQITFSSGKVMSLPSDHSLKIVISEDYD